MLRYVLLLKKYGTNSAKYIQTSEHANLCTSPPPISLQMRKTQTQKIGVSRLSKRSKWDQWGTVG